MAAAFASNVVPVATAGGVGLPAATVAATTWLAVFVVGTFMVRLTLERARKEHGPMRVALPIAALSVVAGALVSAIVGPAPWRLAALAAVPTALAALVVWLRPVSAKRLRTVGWSLVAGNVVALAWLLAFLR